MQNIVSDDLHDLVFQSRNGGGMSYHYHFNKAKADFNVLVGLTIVSFDNGTLPQVGNDEIIFHTADGRKFILYHYQDCCESVSLNEIVGDLADLLNTPILQAEEVSNAEYEDFQDPIESSYGDSHTWTFYRLQTIKGCVVLRWLGTSNGYYSESMTFCEDK